MITLLEGIKVTKYFGGLAAVKDVEFKVGEKELVGLIGPNGAGKSTLFNCISGIYRPTSGTIKFNGKEITRLKPDEICRLGIGRTFQLVRPFLEMTALENVIVAARFGCGTGTSLSDARRRALDHLEFVGISEKKDKMARDLTLHERRFVEIARALATDPEVVLLDEVLAGLNPTETTEAMGLIRRIRNDLGVTVFWVEHVMKAVMGTAERIIVLHHGEKIAEGTPNEIAKNEDVVKAYLGEKYLF
ncbi:MAG: ABC transporter ATP-binding protein [Candidatus Bathyarchaeota archaeon]|nr:ABC transporter ATP-binding protein [Candidatus Bathyarchaeota archaeon]